MEPSTLSGTELFICLLIFLFLSILAIIAWRNKINHERRQTEITRKRLLEVIEQRNTLARMYLLKVIASEKIQKTPEPEPDGLMFPYIQSFYGLLACNLSPEEKRHLDLVNNLMDDSIVTDSTGRYQIP